MSLNTSPSQLLKQAINAARPPTALKADPGMPSSHAQSLFFLATYVAARVAAPLSGAPFTSLRAGAAALLLLGAAALTALRVTLGYHSVPQVVAGAALGAVGGAAWATLGAVWSLPAVAAGGAAGPVLAVLTLGAVAAFAGLSVGAWTRERRV